MPYFPGLEIVDSINQAITDSVNTAVAEANESINGLIDKITVAVNNTIGIKASTGTTLDTLPDIHVWMETGIPWLKSLDVTVTHPPSGSYDLGPAIIGLLNYYGSQLLAALTVEGGGNVVNLPGTPPTGYGGANANDVASAVWAFQLLNATQQLRTADSALTECLAFADSFQRQGTYPVKGTAHFVVFPNGNYLYSWSEDIAPPNPDYTDIQSDDTVLSWLTRTETTRTTWQADANTGFCYSTDLVGDEYQYQIWCTLTDAELLRLGGFGGAVASGGVPVWPGLAGVTLGDAVALAEQVTVDGPLDGVIVSITGVPNNRSGWTYGADEAYIKIGALTFETDNGDLEAVQALGFTSAIYCPRTMQHAAGCRLRCPPDVTGTVTPWSIA